MKADSEGVLFGDFKSELFDVEIEFEKYLKAIL